MPSYVQAGLTLSADGSAPPDVVRELQRDLRALGYLRAGIDGQYGPGTVAAVRALQFDLMNNHGTSTGSDGPAPVAMSEFNGTPGAPAVAAVTGVLDQALAGCLAALVADPRVTQIPFSADPAGDNARALQTIAASASTVAPTPFISAIVRQESAGMHYLVPSHASADDFIVLGQDRNSANADHITSRGYGLGQYTLFHHPPTAAEVKDFMLDPVRNVQKAQAELRDKFDHYLVGPANTADDRQAEHPLLALRLCKYAPGDARYMSDCVNCARASRKVAIAPGTPFYPGANGAYEPTQYYANSNYSNVPDRADFPCDWPYAVRRYNGSGVNSFHYQTHVLLILVALPTA